jgi:hypothetical protein
MGGWAWYDRVSDHEFITLPDHDSDGAAMTADPAPIVWHDSKTGAWWRLKGFCTGEYKLEEGADD